MDLCLLTFGYVGYRKMMTCLGGFRGCFGVVLELFWGLCLGLFWGLFWGVFGVGFGVVLGVVFGVVLELFGENFKTSINKASSV